MDEQASTGLEPLGLDDLAGFLADTPETDPIEDDDTTAEPAPDTDTADEADDQPGDPDEDDEAEKTDPPTDRKIKVQIKGDDGSDSEIEVSEAELASSYLRQSDYTRKTTALAQRETQAVEFLREKHEEVKADYLEKAEFTRAAVIQMAGLKNESEMAQLAQNDPAGWVTEQQRQLSIRNFLGQLDGQMRNERAQSQQQAQQQREQDLNQQFANTWGELAKEKIDRPALAKIYGDVNKTYGFSSEELGNVYDHRLVRMMRDATAYQALKSKAPEVTRKAQAAPPMPSRTTTPAAERKTQAIENRFKGGRAKLSDLAAYLS